LLVAAVAYRRRAIPIAWTWVKGKRGHSSPDKQLALLKHVHGLIPSNIPMFIAEDSEEGFLSIADGQ
jgi:hypothetical protein